MSKAKTIEQVRAERDHYKSQFHIAQGEGTRLVNTKRDLEYHIRNLDSEIARLTPITVAAGVMRVTDGGGYVIGKRRSDEKLPDFWHWIGGKTKDKEPKERALAREVKEEVGVTVAVGKFICNQIVQYDHGTFDIHFYECSTPTADKLKPIACAEVRVASLPEILNFNMLAADMFVAKYVLYQRFFQE